MSGEPRCFPILRWGLPTRVLAPSTSLRAGLSAYGDNRYVWGCMGGGDSALLKNLVYRLRRKIESDPGQPRYIQTVAGEGYIFQS